MFVHCYQYHLTHRYIFFPFVSIEFNNLVQASQLVRRGQRTRKKPKIYTDRDWKKARDWKDGYCINQCRPLGIEIPVQLNGTVCTFGGLSVLAEKHDEDELEDGGQTVGDVVDLIDVETPTGWHNYGCFLHG